LRLSLAFYEIEAYCGDTDRVLAIPLWHRRLDQNTSLIRLVEKFRLIAAASHTPAAMCN
jgi:hypothetical protein